MKNKISQYAVYYGYGHHEALSYNDMVIVEPKAQDLASLKVLRQYGAQVLAYVSVMEVSKEEAAELLLEDRDLIVTSDGTPEVNSYGNYKVDFRSDKWHQHLISQITKLCKTYQYDGLFLDTVGNLESAHIIARYNYELHKAYRALLKEIREIFPDILIIQNNGLDTVFQHARDQIDGVCWENPPIGSLQSVLWVTMTKRKLMEYGKNHPAFLVMILEEGDETLTKTQKFAHKNGWLYYRANHDYL